MTSLVGPGDHVLARVNKDPGTLLHYVVVSEPEEGVFHWCLMPSPHIKRIDFSELRCMELHLHKAGTVPRGDVFPRDELVLDLDSAAGVYTEDEIRRARKMVVDKAVPGVLRTRVQGTPALPGPAPEAGTPDTGAGVRGVAPRRRVRVKSPVVRTASDSDDDERGPANKSHVRGSVHPKDYWAKQHTAKGTGWFVLVPVGEYKIGDEIDFDKVEHVCLKSTGVFSHKDQEGVAVLCKPEDLSRVTRRHRIAMSGRAPDYFRDLEEIYVDPDATPRAKQTEDAKKPVSDDFRILDITFDGADERFKSVDQAVQSYEEHDMIDWPVDGYRTGLYTSRQLRRAQQNFMQQHESWKKHSGIRERDRAVFEHFALSRFLPYAMTYDQLAVQNLACCEVLIKRRQLIERAYKLGGPEAPNYSGSDYFQGIRGSSDSTIIDPALSKYAGDKLHSDYEMTKNARLAFGERGKMPLVPEGGDDLGAVPDPKGKGKNKRPKAQATPAGGGGAQQG